MKKTNRTATSIEERERYTAALSYVWILCLYTLLFKRKSAFIHFHAKQGLVLFVIEVILFAFPPVIIICIIVAIFGIRSALMGKYWRIPLIGDLINKSDF